MESQLFMQTASAIKHQHLNSQSHLLYSHTHGFAKNKFQDGETPQDRKWNEDGATRSRQTIVKPYSATTKRTATIGGHHISKTRGHSGIRVSITSGTSSHSGDAEGIVEEPILRPAASIPTPKQRETDRVRRGYESR
jgi:hypothetical protein